MVEWNTTHRPKMENTSQTHWHSSFAMMDTQEMDLCLVLVWIQGSGVDQFQPVKVLQKIIILKLSCYSF